MVDRAAMLTNARVELNSKQAQMIETYKPSAKNARFLAFIIEDGLRWEQAADLADMKRTTAKLLLREERVIKYIKQRRNLHRAVLCANHEAILARVRDGDEPRWTLRAIQMLEQLNGGFEPDPADKSEASEQAPSRFMINIINRSDGGGPTASVVDQQLASTMPQASELRSTLLSPEGSDAGAGGKNQR